MTSQSDSSWRRWIRRALIFGVVVLAVLLVGLAFFWFGTAPRVPKSPLHFARDESGRMVPVGEQGGESGGRFEAQAGTIQAKNDFSVECMEVRSGGCRFACRRLAVLNRSDHLLMARVGPLVAEELSKLPYVERIDYYPAGHRPEDGELGPDLFITLDAQRIEESGLPLSRKLEADIVVGAGNRLFQPRNSYSDGTEPPVVDLDLRGRLTHRSTTGGLRSSAAKFKLPAKNVAAQIAEHLKKKFDENHEKDGPLPDLPDDFYPPFREAETLPILEQYDAELLASHHGLLTANQSTWRVTADGEAGEVIERMLEALKEAGWKGETDSAGDRAYFRVTKGSKVLTGFTHQPAGPMAGARLKRSVEVLEGSGETPPSPPAEATIYLNYEDRMSRQEQAEAVERLLEEDVPIETLLVLRNRWTSSLESRVLERLQSEPPTTAEGWLVAAELYHRAERDAEALEALERAGVLVRTLSEPGDLDDRIRKLAKELGREDLLETPPTAERFREMGLIELAPDMEVPDLERKLGEPAHFFGTTAEGWVKVISIRVVRNTPEEGYQIAHVETLEHGRSWGAGGMEHWTTIQGTCRVRFTAEPITGEERFRLKTEVTGLGP